MRKVTSYQFQAQGHEDLQRLLLELPEDQELTINATFHPTTSGILEDMLLAVGCLEGQLKKRDEQLRIWRHRNGMNNPDEDLLEKEFPYPLAKEEMETLMERLGEQCEREKLNPFAFYKMGIHQDTPSLERRFPSEIKNTYYGFYEKDPELLAVFKDYARQVSEGFRFERFHFDHHQNPAQVKSFIRSQSPHRYKVAGLWLSTNNRTVTRDHYHDHDEYDISLGTNRNGDVEVNVWEAKVDIEPIIAAMFRAGLKQLEN